MTTKKVHSFGLWLISSLFWWFAAAAVILQWGGMTIDFIKNTQPMLLIYTQLSFTVFGISLIGAIFERERTLAIVKQLLLLSIAFLSAGVLFLLIYALTFFESANSTFLTIIFAAAPFVVTFASGLFIGGLWGLIWVLVSYFLQVLKPNQKRSQ